MPTSKISVSIVNYTNTLPFKWALKQSPLIHQIDLQEDMPSICAQKLKFKQVDLALVPIVLLNELSQYFIETNYCIGANGHVESVKLYSQIPLNEINTITLDYQSKTSIALTKVFVHFFWKIKVVFLEANPGFENEINGKNAAVVIGDRTFAMNGNYNYEYDLAAEWKKFTGLPFVFAAWVSTKKLNTQFLENFNDVLKFGVQHIKLAVYNDASIGNEIKIKTMRYLTHCIDYDFNPDKKKALALFLSYVKQL